MITTWFDVWEATHRQSAKTVKSAQHTVAGGKPALSSKRKKKGFSQQCLLRCNKELSFVCRFAFCSWGYPRLFAMASSQHLLIRYFIYVPLFLPPFRFNLIFAQSPLIRYVLCIQAKCPCEGSI